MGIKTQTEIIINFIYAFFLYEGPYLSSYFKMILKIIVTEGWTGKSGL